METVTILLKDANPRSKPILEVIEKIQEDLEPKVLTDQLNCAEEFITKGNYDEALKVYKDVYRKGDNPIWKADMCDVASACKNLAHVLNQLGKHGEALEIVEGNLEVVKSILESEHHWTYLLQGSLAYTYRGLGNYKEALKLHNDAYQGLLFTLDEDHEEMLILRKEIAVDLSLLGRHEESICLFMEVLEKLKTTSGKESYEVILAQIEFVEAIETSNEGLQDALEILVNVNEVMAETLDKESILFLRVSKIISKLKDKLFSEPFNRAQEFMKAANYEGALKVYKEDVYWKGYGWFYKADLSLFISTGKKVAFVLNQMGHHKESVKFLEKVLELVENEVGKEDLLMVSLLWNLASLHQSQGHFDIASDIRQNANQLLGNLD